MTTLRPVICRTLLLLSPCLFVAPGCMPSSPSAARMSVLFQTDASLEAPSAAWWKAETQDITVAESCVAEGEGFRCTFGEAPSASAGSLRLVLGDTTSTCALPLDPSSQEAAAPDEDPAQATGPTCPWPMTFTNAEEVSPTDTHSLFQSQPEADRLLPEHLTLRWSESDAPAAGLIVVMTEPTSGILWRFRTDGAGHPLADPSCALWEGSSCTLPTGPEGWQVQVYTLDGIRLAGSTTWSPETLTLSASCPDADGDQIPWDGCGIPTADCDDSDPLTYPGAQELPYDGIDQDCSGSDLLDVDGDGVIGAPAGPDCDDQDPQVYPGAPEDLQDSIDQDCDGFLQQDLDQDGFITWNLTEPLQADCNDQNASAFPGAPDAIDDGQDLNCDGYADTLERFAGVGVYNGEGLAKEQTTFSSPDQLAIAPDGRLWISDGSNNRIRRVDEQDRVYTQVGDGIARGLPDEGPADPLSVSLHHPEVMAYGPDGALYLADTYNYRIRVLRPSGLLETFAGNGVCTYAGDGGPATEASITTVDGLAVGPDGTVYFSDVANHRVRKVSPDGVIETIAGDGTAGDSGDGGDALLAQLDWPTGLALDDEGNLYISDTNRHRIRKVTPDGIMRTYAGTGVAEFNGDGHAPAETTFNAPMQLLRLSDGTLVVSDVKNHRIRQLLDQEVRTLTGDGSQNLPEASPFAVDSPFAYPAGLAEGLDGTLYVSSFSDRRVWEIDAAGSLQEYAGRKVEGKSTNGAPALDASFYGLTDVATDNAGNTYIPDRGYSVVYKVSPEGSVEVVAGNGVWGYSGDGGQALDAAFRDPYGIDVDTKGRLYIADNQNHCVRRIDENGIVTTLAGTGISGYSGDGGLAKDAQLAGPTDVSVSLENNVYIADKYNHRIRVYFAATGKIQTWAGTGQEGFIGDGGSALEARLSFPRSVRIDSERHKLYISDLGNMRIRVVDMSTGLISTFAGTGEYSVMGDGLPATASPVYYPGYLTQDAEGRLIFSQAYRVRRVETDGTVRTLAGMIPYGLAGEDGPALDAAFYHPMGVAMNPSGSLLIVDPDSYRVVMVRP